MEDSAFPLQLHNISNINDMRTEQFLANAAPHSANGKYTTVAPSNPPINLILSPSSLPILPQTTPQLGALDPLNPVKKIKKKRAARACVSCRKVHIACDGNLPCGKCINKGNAHTCFYDLNEKKRAKKKTSEQQETQGTFLFPFFVDE